MAALKLSKVSNKINTAFVERQNGTDRGRNGRKTRKTYCFSVVAAERRKRVAHGASHGWAAPATQ
jgi:hypothetical protein